MAENVVLNNLANLQNDTTTISVINGNNATITSAFTDVLSRTGVQPNTMGAALDMNNWPIMNLPAPGSANSPARLIDITTPGQPINISLSLAGDVTAPASSGVLTTTVGKVNGVSYPATPSAPTNSVPVVTSSGVVGYQQIAAANIAANTITASQIAGGTITNTQIATNTISNSNIRQGNARSVIGVTGNISANVADITGTTRQVLAVNTAGTALTFAQPQGDQLLGTTTNDNATAGNIGEFIQSTVLQGSAAALTTGVPINITSISLTAGDWDIFGSFYIIPANTTAVFLYTGSFSTTSATHNLVPGFFNQTGLNGIVVTANPVGFSIGPQRVSLSGTTTYFLVGSSTFQTSTNAGFGFIGARRVR